MLWVWEENPDGTIAVHDTDDCTTENVPRDLLFGLLSGGTEIKGLAIRGGALVVTGQYKVRLKQKYDAEVRMAMRRAKKEMQTTAPAPVQKQQQAPVQVQGKIRSLQEHGALLAIRTVKVNAQATGFKWNIRGIAIIGTVNAYTFWSDFFTQNNVAHPSVEDAYTLIRRDGYVCFPFACHENMPLCKEFCLANAVEFNVNDGNIDWETIVVAPNFVPTAQNPNEIVPKLDWQIGFDVDRLTLGQFIQRYSADGYVALKQYRRNWSGR